MRHFDSGGLKPSCQTEALFSQSKEKNSSRSGTGLDFFNHGNCVGSAGKTVKTRYFCLAEARPVSLSESDLLFNSPRGKNFFHLTQQC